MPPPEEKFLCPCCEGPMMVRIRNDCYYEVDTKTGAMRPMFLREGPFVGASLSCADDCDVQFPFEVKMHDDGWEVVTVK